jgi:hypothetical protein
MPKPLAFKLLLAKNEPLRGIVNYRCGIVQAALKIAVIATHLTTQRLF